MVLSILFGKKYQKGKVGSVELDATLVENHRYSSNVTTYPIESGPILTDHIVNEPVIINLEGIVTDTPLLILSPFNRSIDAFNRLIEIHRNREIVTVVTGLKTYQNMAITSFEVPRNVDTGQSLRFNIELQEIILDTTVRIAPFRQTVFGESQSNIPREILSDGSNLPYIMDDPPNSIKDQGASGFDHGTQFLIPPSQAVAAQLQSSLDFIQRVA